MRGGLGGLLPGVSRGAASGVKEARHAGIFNSRSPGRLADSCLAFLPPQKRVVYLYGAPASGKTTLGRRLALALDCDFVDLDAVIVHNAGRPIAEIFGHEGEAHFRELESKELRLVGEYYSKKPTATVIALGGGTLLTAENRAFCEETGTVLCLDTPPVEELERRLRSRNDTPEDQIEMRLKRAVWEMEQRVWYDYVVVNAQLEPCVREVLEIIAKECGQTA